MHPPRAARALALLPLFLPPAARVRAGKDTSYRVTKKFSFKNDVHLEFAGLPTAIGPDSVDVLLAALNGAGFVDRFRNVWIREIEDDLLGGGCVVDRMRPPEFSMCDWKYPDKYDVDELPTPGQCYEYRDQFVSGSEKTASKRSRRSRWVCKSMAGKFRRLQWNAIVASGM